MTDMIREYHENEDNKDLAPIAAKDGFLVFGYIDIVNGRGAKECAEYVLTRHELIQLAAHWYEEILTVREEELSRCYGGSERRVSQYARRRLSMIKELIGEEAIEEEFARVRQKFGRRFSLEDRQAFFGTEQEYLDLSERFLQALEELEAIDLDQVFRIIRNGSTEHPVASQVIAKELGLQPQQVWLAIRNLMVNGKVVCFAPLEACFSEPQSLVYWCPESDDEQVAWVAHLRRGASELVRLVSASEWHVPDPGVSGVKHLFGLATVISPVLWVVVPPEIASHHALGTGLRCG